MESTMTRKLTQAAILSLAKKKYGKNCVLNQHSKPLTPGQRQANSQRLKANNARIKEIQQCRKDNFKHWEELLEAAEFCVGVNGDEPSMSQLKEAVALSRRMMDLQEEQKELEFETRRIPLRSYKWTLAQRHMITGLGGFDTVIKDADSLEELHQFLNGKN